MVRQVKAPAPKPVDPSSAPDSPQRGRREAVSCLLISTSTPGHVCSHTPEDTQNKNVNVIFFLKKKHFKTKRKKKGRNRKCWLHIGGAEWEGARDDFFLEDDTGLQSKDPSSDEQSGLCFKALADANKFCFSSWVARLMYHLYDILNWRLVLIEAHVVQFLVVALLNTKLVANYSYFTFCSF